MNSRLVLPAPVRRHRRVVRACAVLAASAVVAAIGVSTAAPGSATTDPACPSATDLTTLTPGAPLHGLTVSAGTTPDAFTGTVIGIEKDGIVPGVDLVIVTLDSPAIDAAGGVWQGMSGSPVYAADDSLVGAVSWGLSYGASHIIGLTPAAEMQAMLDDTSPGPAALPDHVLLSPAMQRAVVRTGDATPAAARSGMRPMALPLAVSGLSTLRVDQLASDLDGVRPYSAPAVSTAAAQTDEIVPGGNLAASIAYGSFSAVAVGTATEVCGDQVLAFGHPLMDVPRGDLTMHGADALYVQPDSLGQPFKVANVSGPVGSVPDNLLAGLHGYLGAAPEATEVHSVSTLGDEEPVVGTTYISLRPLMPTYLAFSAVSVEDRALSVNMNSWFGALGSDLVYWTVQGVRADGSPFSMSRLDRFASATDVAYTWPWALHDELNQLLNNETETVTITSVSTTSQTDPEYQHLVIAGLEKRVSGAWRPVTSRKALQVRAGTTQQLRVVMHSAALGTRTKVFAVDVPAKAAGRSGSLSVSGGDDVYAEAPPEATVDRMLKVFAAEPRNDEVVTSVSFAGLPASAGRLLTKATVGGSLDVAIRVVS